MRLHRDDNGNLSGWSKQEEPPCTSRIGVRAIHREVNTIARTESIPNEVLEFLLEKLMTTVDIDTLWETSRWLVQELIELDISREIAADHYQHSDGRKNYRNGSRQRTLGISGRHGNLHTQLRKGSYYPEWLRERGLPGERALRQRGQHPEDGAVGEEAARAFPSLSAGSGR